MTVRDDDASVWRLAVKAFKGKALADIERTAGVSRSVARRLREGQDVPDYLHERTRESLSRWQTLSAMLYLAHPPAEKPPGRTLAPLPTPNVEPMSDASLRGKRLEFETERERLHVIQQALRTAERYRELLGSEIADALSAVTAPLSARGNAFATAPGEGADDDAAALAEIGDRVQEQVAGQRKPPARKVRAR